MRRLSQLLLIVGLLVGVGDAAAILLHLGLAGAPWLVNVALAKLGLVASLGLLSGGAVTGRLARREEARRLSDGAAP
jgi:hypothetical protein